MDEIRAKVASRRQAEAPRFVFMELLVSWASLWQVVELNSPGFASTRSLIGNLNVIDIYFSLQGPIPRLPGQRTMGTTQMLMRR